MGLLRLAPSIQRRILGLPETASRSAVSERSLRPIARLQAAEQRRRFAELCSKVA
jgi:hypothetical protein